MISGMSALLYLSVQNADFHMRWLGVNPSCAISGMHPLRIGRDISSQLKAGDDRRCALTSSLALRAMLLSAFSFLLASCLQIPDPL
jgi:hypothetical protein